MIPVAGLRRGAHLTRLRTRVTPPTEGFDGRNGVGIRTGGGRGAGGLLAAGVLVICAVAIAGWPLAMLAWNAGATQPPAGGNIGAGGKAIESTGMALLASTVAYGAVISGLAVVLSIPAAWWLRGRPLAAGIIVLAPMLLPNYLAYSGLGVLRGPRTWLGDIIERAAPGHAALPALVGEGVAILGLALWLWPLPALVIGSGVSRVSDDLLDNLALEPAGWWRRVWFLGGLLRRSLLTAWGFGLLVMLGSAVPLHLANIPTFATRIWFLLTLTPGGSAVIAAAWPLVLVALVASWFLGGRVAGGGAPAPAPVRYRGGSWRMIGLLSASVVVPAAVAGGSMRDPANIALFIRVNGRAIADSGLVAACVAAGAGGIAVAAWLALASGRWTTVVTWSVRLLLVTGLLPGVLTGRAVALAFASIGSELAESPIPLVLGHLARFAWIAAAAGCLAARAEGSQRELRRLDRAEGLFGWLLACWPGHGGLVVAASLTCGLLSLHEIEASILIQPAGMISLAQTMLGFLHYSRMEELSAGLVLLAAAGGVVVTAAWWGLRRTGGPHPARH